MAIAAAPSSAWKTSCPSACRTMEYISRASAWSSTSSTRRAWSRVDRRCAARLACRGGRAAGSRTVNVEPCAVRLARGLDRSAVQLDELPDQREADAEPALGAVAGVVGLDEEIEDVRQQVRADAAAFVGDAQHGLGALGASPTRGRACRAGENLSALETRLPTICSRRTGSAFTQTGSDRRSRPGRRSAGRREAGHAGAHALGQVDRLALEHDLAGHDPADVEQIVDEAGHVQRLPLDDVAGVNGARLAQRRQVEHLHRALDRAQRDCAARARAWRGTRPWTGSRAAPSSAC